MKAWRGDDLRVRRLGAHGGATWQSRKRRKHGRPSPTRAAATVRPPVRRSPRRARRSRRTSTSSLTRSTTRSEEHTSELQSQSNLVCRLLLEKKKKPPELPLATSRLPTGDFVVGVVLVASVGSVSPGNFLLVAQPSSSSLTVTPAVASSGSSH